MNLSRFTLTAAGLLMAGASSIALARGPVDRLAERLELDDQQAATISALFEEHRDYMKNEIQRRDADGNPDPAAREQAAAAREALHQEILSVLDEEQAGEFERIIERRHHRRGRDRHGRRMAYAFGQLDLDDSQKEAVKALMAERRATRMDNQEAFRAELASILTEDQLEQLDAMRH